MQCFCELVTDLHGGGNVAVSKVEIDNLHHSYATFCGKAKFVYVEQFSEALKILHLHIEVRHSLPGFLPHRISFLSNMHLRCRNICRVNTSSSAYFMFLIAIMMARLISGNSCGEALSC
jgi:hypothetical protein